MEWKILEFDIYAVPWQPLFCWMFKFNTQTTLKKEKKEEYYSSPSLTTSSCLPRNCDHVREVAFGEGEKYTDSSSDKDLWPY